MKKKELIAFQIFSLLVIFLFGISVGAQGILSLIWRNLNDLIIRHSVDTQALLKSLQTTSAYGLKIACLLGIVMVIVTIANLLIFGKKYRQFLNSLEK